MKSGSVGCGTANGAGRRPNGSGRSSNWKTSPGCSCRTLAIATTDFSLRAIASTSTRSIAAAASMPDGGSWAGSEPWMLKQRIKVAVVRMRNTILWLVVGAVAQRGEFPLPRQAAEQLYEIAHPHGLSSGSSVSLLPCPLLTARIILAARRILPGKRYSNTTPEDVRNGRCPAGCRSPGGTNTLGITRNTKKNVSASGSGRRLGPNPIVIAKPVAPTTRNGVTRRANKRGVLAVCSSSTPFNEEAEGPYVFGLRESNMAIKTHALTG